MQLEVTKYLQCELFHLLGAYGWAEEQLAELSESLEGMARQDPGGPASEATDLRSGPEALRELVDMSQVYNHDLKFLRYASRPAGVDDDTGDNGTSPYPTRDPRPRKLPLTKAERFEVGPEDASIEGSRRSPWISDKTWMLIPDFYRTVVKALEETSGGDAPKRGGDSVQRAERTNLQALAASVSLPRESAVLGPEAKEARVKRRLDRYGQRHQEAFELIGSHDFGGDSDKEARKALQERIRDHARGPGLWPLEKICGDDLSAGFESMAMFVLRVHTEGHLAMHAVESWRNLSLGAQAKHIQDPFGRWLDDELDRCIALSTFAFCAGRVMPWIFAKDGEEREIIRRGPKAAWENMIPVRCLWIATQVSLLSLHRRAYARALKGDPTRAYNDYHKLQYLIRDTERRVRAAPLHVKGALVFLAGMNAEAHHHIGELYKSQHAHRPALEHFRAASHGLENLKKEAGGEAILQNSRWYVELQVSYGKACYEMGRHKEALYWHLSAWRNFLVLLASETSTEVNTKAIDNARAWLDRGKYEPEINKSDIEEQLGPVVEQLDRITMVGRLGALAGEILLRLGHLLFVLDLPSKLQSTAEGKPTGLDVRCLRKAEECDPHGTLVHADLLKAGLRKAGRPGRARGNGDPEELSTLPEIGKQWPGGGDDFEKLARAAEYLLLQGRRWGKAASGVEPEEKVARALMLDLFLSTDSTNVRKSQIHRFLMRGRAKGPPPSGEPRLELVCMRRYSSAFPLLPRPSAFRALGGGYFIRLHNPRTGDAATAAMAGIVVDPGNDFVENLYRAGYSLSDIDMIVITHDHVDHLGGLDPLLSLLHVRGQILFKESEGEGERPQEVRVLTSLSVYERYESAMTLKRNPETLKFESLEGRERVERKNERRPVLEATKRDRRVTVGGVDHSFELLRMSSSFCNPQEGARAGHRDLSDRPSLGVCIRTDPSGPSIAITSDTPEPRFENQRARRKWEREWKPALEADVLVCHLGSVPLPELRRVDGRHLIKSHEVTAWVEEEEKGLNAIYNDLAKARPNLQGQIEYAHWLRSHQPDGEPEVEAAGLVGPVSEAWLPPRDHNYLRGLLTWAAKFAEASPRTAPGGGRLFVVGELSEELGTMRGKLAKRLDDFVFERSKGRPDRPRRHSALTADIGLHAQIMVNAKGEKEIKILCTTCNLDTDRAPSECLHPGGEIDEVCVKGENEGIFYNCSEHHPTSRQDDQAFLERLERFDIFGR